MAAKKRNTGPKGKKKTTAKQADLFKLDREKMREPVSKVDPKTARFSTLEKERSRIYSERGRLKKKLGQATKKVDIKTIRSRIRRTTYFLDQIKRRKKTFVPVKGFESQINRREDAGDERGVVVQRFVYKWEASKQTDEVLNSPHIKIYFVNGERFTRREAGLILAAVDDLETECDLTGTYYMVFTIEQKTRTLIIERGK
jgi:hypothetical protein